MQLRHLAATTITLSLPQTYGYVLLAGALMSLQLLLFGFIFPGQARKKYFNKKFMRDNFNEAHLQAFNQELDTFGYPDMGSGIYAQKLGYKEWVEFNNAQRAHYNFFEFAPSTLVWLFVGGIYFPIASAALGLVVIISRIIYGVGYASKGSGGRFTGVLGNDLAIIGMFGLSVASSIMFILGNTP